MLMPKKNRQLIYEYLFNEGVMVAKKDPYAPKHPDVAVPNLHVIKTLQSLKSKEYVKEQFAWRHYYWYLTNAGVAFLREYLGLPPEIVPATLKRQVRSESSRPRGKTDQQRSGYGAADAERASYRRAPTDKTADAGAGAQDFQFKGGYGRGKPQ